MKFIRCKDSRVAQNENYIVFKLDSDKYDAVFSVCRKGDACVVHFYGQGRNLLKILRQVFPAFKEFVFDLFPWCKMILIYSNARHISRILEDCHCDLCATQDDFNIYGIKPWDCHKQ